MRLLTDMLVPEEPHDSTQLGYHDGSQRRVHWSAREVPYPDGRLIVTVEEVSGASLSMTDTLIALHRLPEVLAATLAYESSDSLLFQNDEHPEHSPCAEAQP